MRQRWRSGWGDGWGIGCAPLRLVLFKHFSFGVVADDLDVDEAPKVEPLGSEVFAYLSANGHEFISRMDATANPRPGETIETVFDTDHLHVFDKETEQALV